MEVRYIGNGLSPLRLPLLRVHFINWEVAMRMLGVLLGIGAVCSLALLWHEPNASVAQPPPPADQQEGVEVLTRGPMHEAYAAPQSLDPKPSPLVPKAPPEPVPESPPDQKPDGSHVVWISGYWAWDDATAEYMWISGFWRDLPPGKRWLPGHWAEVQGGWQWTSGVWGDEAQTSVSYVPAPPPTLETGPTIAAPAADQFYTPGTWVYVERKYRWRPGFWLTHRPNWVYIPAHYEWTPAGCVFVNGYWDYEITRRGLLFCPVRFTANVWLRPGWRLRHLYLVYPEMIVGALFVRPDYHRYCFGDYFGPKYLEHGFIPWVDFRLRVNIPEPLFHQYAYAHRAEVNWERDLRTLYTERRLGTALRPPRTIVLQEQYRRDLLEHKAIKVGEKTFTFKDVKVAERTVLMGNTLAKVDRKVIPLKAMTPAAHAEVIKTIEHHAAVKQERTISEAKIFKETPVFKPSDPHHVVNLPAVPKHLESPKTIVLPVTPVIPTHVEKVVPKFELPKAPKANTKPLPHSGLSRPRDTLAARLEWIDAGGGQAADRRRVVPLLG
jgi:hypothetical protein